MKKIQLTLLLFLSFFSHTNVFAADVKNFHEIFKDSEVFTFNNYLDPRKVKGFYCDTFRHAWNQHYRVVLVTSNNSLYDAYSTIGTVALDPEQEKNCEDKKNEFTKIIAQAKTEGKYIVYDSSKYPNQIVIPLIVNFPVRNNNLLPYESAE